MNTKLSYVEFLQQLNDPKSILYKLYDIKYNNCNINTDWYFFSSATEKVKLPTLTLTDWITEWSDLCHRFTFRYKLVDNESAPYIFGDITLITFETRTLILPVAYVNLIDDCIKTILDHNLISVLSCYDYDTANEDYLRADLQAVIDQFCTPVLDNDADMVIRSL